MATPPLLLSCYTLLNLFFFLLLIEKISLVSARELAGEYDRIDVQSLVDSIFCSVPEKGMSPSKLKVVQQDGPCPSLTLQEKQAIMDQILEREQARANYTQRMFAERPRPQPHFEAN